MCRYCVEYGNGTKWYLNPDNFRQELTEHPGWMALTGTERNTYEWSGSRDLLEYVTPDLNDTAIVNPIIDTMSQQSGHVIPLEDALKIVDIAPGDRLLLQHCGCRRYYGHGDFYGCMFFDVAVDRTKEQRPWETDTKILTKDEARQVIKDRHAMGLVISIFDSGTFKEGKPPLCFCFCNEAECAASKKARYLNISAIFRKSEYVANVDPLKCAKGCQDSPACIMKCQWGALKYSPLRKVVTINHNDCYGCGLCRTACKQGAIKLVDRTTYPALVDSM